MSGTARLRHFREFMARMYPAFSRRATQVCILSSALEKIALGATDQQSIARAALDEADAFGWKQREALRLAGAAGPLGDPEVVPPPLPQTVPIEEYRRVVGRCIDLGEKLAARTNGVDSGDAVALAVVLGKPELIDAAGVDSSAPANIEQAVREAFPYVFGHFRDDPRIAESFAKLRSIVGVREDGMFGDYTRRMARLGQYVTDFAKQIGWAEDSGEGAFEFIQRTSYRQGWEDGKQEASGDIHRDGVRGGGNG